MNAAPSRCCSAPLITTRASAGVRVMTSEWTGRGGFAREAGFWTIRPHCTATSSALRSTCQMYSTVRFDSPDPDLSAMSF
jgi:hypothetical protein